MIDLPELPRKTIPNLPIGHLKPFEAPKFNTELPFLVESCRFSHHQVPFEPLQQLNNLF